MLILTLPAEKVLHNDLSNIDWHNIYMSRDIDKFGTLRMQLFKGVLYYIYLWFDHDLNKILLTIKAYVIDLIITNK